MQLPPTAPNKGSIIVRFILIFMGVAPLAWAKFRAVTAFKGLGIPCIFKKITGSPCPFCYGTRSWILIMGGEIMDGIAVNPMGALLFLLDWAVILYLVVAIIFRLPELPVQNWLNKKAVLLSMLAMVIVNWIYVLIYFHFFGLK